jgi:hypothetical protein
MKNTIHYGTITIEHKNKRVEVKEAIYRAGATVYKPFKNPFKEPVKIVTCDIDNIILGTFRDNT